MKEWVSQQIFSPRNNYEVGQNYQKQWLHGSGHLVITNNKLRSIYSWKIATLCMRTVGVCGILAWCCSCSPTAQLVQYFYQGRAPWQPRALLPERADMIWRGSQKIPYKWYHLLKKKKANCSKWTGQVSSFANLKLWP